ncbi:zinc-ribbon domain-containing protein, partial [Candidatus Pelagibacter sp.]|nr:zinc-ribbon domain-containing protein [Candidatus Pelagibacter sp.]
MIITCKNCTKKFEVDADLIPDKGRLLQCMKCQHTWFFKNVISIDTDKSNDSKSPALMENTSVSVKDDLDNKELSANKIKKSTNFTKSNLVKKKRIGIINLTLVFIISFIALIILT